MIPKASLRKRAPEFITAREIIRRHLHEAGMQIQDLAPVWGIKRFSVWRVFTRTDQRLLPGQVESLIAHLHLDAFDANELRLAAAREAGYPIDPKFLLEAA